MNTMSEVMPAVAAPTKSASRLVVPATVRRPARRPFVSVLARIKDMFGPGVRPRTMQVAMKAARTSGDMGSPGMCSARSVRNALRCEGLVGQWGTPDCHGHWLLLLPACHGLLIEPWANQ